MPGSDVDEAKLEPCSACGEETAVGSYSYSSRREATTRDGTRTFICADCVERERRSHRPAEPLPVDRQSAEAAGSVLLRVHGF